MTPPLPSIISRLHLKQLRLLVALGEHGSLLKASRQVALTQPGASKALQEIETTFGTSLFVRTNRGLEPNDVGHCVIRYARLIQTDVSHRRDEIVGILRGQGGRVAAGVIMGAVPLLTDAISALVARQADLSVEIVEDTSAALLAQLDAGRLDLAICRTTVSQTLGTSRTMQQIPVKAVTTSEVRLRITAVSPPGKGRAARDDTAISEVLLIGHAS